MTEKYYFTMRKDIPSGFIQNERIPELPAAYKFLQMYCGLRYASRQEFEKDLAGFRKYLRQNEVPLGNDQEVRRGIFVFDDDAVGVRSKDPTKRCEFGRLEREVSGI